MLERGIVTFQGGPCNGEKVETWLPSRTKQHLFRSGTKGDDTIYSHRGQGFHLYYRWFDTWRWEGLDTFDVLYGPVAQLVRVPDCRSGGCGFEPHQGRLFVEDIEELQHFIREDWKHGR